MRRANASARQHGNRQLRRHPHVDGNTVAFADAEVFQNVRELLHRSPELLVGEGPNLARFALPNQRSLVLARSLNMAIEAVIGKIELAANEPLRPGLVPLQNLVPLFEPVQLFGGPSPEFFRLLHRLLIQGFIFGQALNLRLRGKFWRRRKTALLIKS